MRNATVTVLLTALLGLGLAGCSTAPDEEPPASSAPTASEAPSEATTAAEAAEELCATASESDDDQVCVLDAATASEDLSFTAYRVVKLVGGTFDGAVDISGAEQVTITDAEFAADLSVDVRGGAVVKLSTIGGTLSVAGGEHSTLVKNTVGGDLLCADGVQANGNGNSVSGEVTGTCSRVL